MVDDEQLSVAEIESIQVSLKAVEEGHIEFVHPDLAVDTLQDLWYPELASPDWLLSEPACPGQAVGEPAQQYTATGPGWYIGMSAEFLRGTQNIDRKLQGRIFEAIAHISKEPTTLKGDTVKPLASGLKGLWRYRIGDFRLVYQPDGANKRITLLSFDSRGAVYG